jgi:hypothetical protein
MKQIYTHYQKLNVSRSATDIEIIDSFNDLLKKYNPDNCSDYEKDRFIRITNNIKKSYDILINPITRMEHDLWIDKQKNYYNATEKKFLNFISLTNFNFYFSNITLKIIFILLISSFFVFYITDVVQKKDIPISKFDKEIVFNSDQKCNQNIITTTPANQFKDNNDGTVTDNKTGLMWQKCSEGQTGNFCEGLPKTYTFEGALQQQINKNSRDLLNYFVGYKDWRLPTMLELMSLIEQQCANPAINASIFPNTDPKYFWTNDVYVDDLSLSWVINFYDGENWARNKGMTFNVRLVRGG